MILLPLLLTLLVSAPPEKCGTLEISLSSGSVPSGGSLGIFNKVTNCGTRKTSYTILETVTTACGATTQVLQSDPGDMNLDPNQAAFQNTSYIAPPDCNGTYTITGVLRTSNGSQVLATTQTTFIVE